MNRVAIEPRMIAWARERSGLDVAALKKRFPAYEEWESGEKQPTVRQLEDFARATLTPFGALFLAEPPEDRLPVPDFRTLRAERPRRPSAALLQTIYQMQRRQEWMRDYLIDEGAEPLPFIGTATLASSPQAAAEDIRRTLHMEEGWAEAHATWSAALLGLRRAVEDAGVLVVISGVYGNNTHRPLDPDEFRGFVLSDPYAPLIFVNGADFKAAQMFTLAHELAHLWLGKDGVFDLPNLQPSEDAVEQFCNKVAAEVLVPEEELLASWPRVAGDADRYQALARRFKVSPMVTARRVLDAGLISRAAFFEFLEEYEADERRKTKKSGGHFYRTSEVRIGHRFGAAVVRAARAGKLLYRDAYRLTGLSGKTFDRFAQELGFGAA